MIELERFLATKRSIREERLDQLLADLRKDIHSLPAQWRYTFHLLLDIITELREGTVQSYAK
jgi:hypothetical protein